MDASAYFGQDHQPQILILHMDCLPQPVPGLSRDAIDEGKGIDASAAPLVNPLLQKHRIAVG